MYVSMYVGWLVCMFLKWLNERAILFTFCQKHHVVTSFNYFNNFICECLYLISYKLIHLQNIFHFFSYISEQETPNNMIWVSNINLIHTLKNSTAFNCHLARVREKKYCFIYTTYVFMYVCIYLPLKLNIHEIFTIGNATLKYHHSERKNRDMKGKQNELYL